MLPAIRHNYSVSSHYVFMPLFDWEHAHWPCSVVGFHVSSISLCKLGTNCTTPTEATEGLKLVHSLPLCKPKSENLLWLQKPFTHFWATCTRVLATMPRSLDIHQLFIGLHLPLRPFSSFSVLVGRLKKMERLGHWWANLSTRACGRTPARTIQRCPGVPFSYSVHGGPRRIRVLNADAGCPWKLVTTFSWLTISSSRHLLHTPTSPSLHKDAANAYQSMFLLFPSFARHLGRGTGSRPSWTPLLLLCTFQPSWSLRRA